MAVVYYDTAAAGAGTGANWTDAFTTLAAAITGAGLSGTIYVASSSSEANAGGAASITVSGTIAAPMRIISANKAGSVPPVAADLQAGALYKTTASGGTITFAGGSAVFNGMTIKCSEGQSAAGGMVIGSGGGQCFVFENGQLWSATTFATGTIAMANNAVTVIFRNNTLKFGAVGQKFNVNSGSLYWSDTANAIDTGGSVPTTLFSVAATSLYMIERVDFNAFTGASQLFGTASVTSAGIFMEDCKYGSGGGPGQFLSIGGGNGTIARCGSATSADNSIIRLQGAGLHTINTNVARSGGASADGALPFSWSFAPTANNNVNHRPKGINTEVYNTLTGAGHTVTMYGCANKATMPTNADVWMEAAALLDSTSPLKTMVSSGLSNILATAAGNTADTSDWTAGTVAARLNSTLYNVGDRIKVASNTGRVFMCTVGGTTAGSEPGGYASAVDGGAVVDGGTATFRALWRFSMVVTLGTIDRAGIVVCYPRYGSATTTDTYWIDPDPVIA